jgi:hypothetical protein
MEGGEESRGGKMNLTEVQCARMERALLFMSSCEERLNDPALLSNRTGHKAGGGSSRKRRLFRRLIRLDNSDARCVPWGQHPIEPARIAS